MLCLARPREVFLESVINRASAQNQTPLLKTKRSKPNMLLISLVACSLGDGARVLGGGGGIPAAGLRTFTTALKNVKLEPGVETTLLARVDGGCLTQFWFTAETTWLAVGDEALLRVYVDGEDTPSIAGRLDRCTEWAWVRTAVPPAR